MGRIWVVPLKKRNLTLHSIHNMNELLQRVQPIRKMEWSRVIHLQLREDICTHHLIHNMNKIQLHVDPLLLVWVRLSCSSTIKKGHFFTHYLMIIWMKDSGMSTRCGKIFEVELFIYNEKKKILYTIYHPTYQQRTQQRTMECTSFHTPFK